MDIYKLEAIDTSKLSVISEFPVYVPVQDFFKAFSKKGSPLIVHELMTKIAKDAFDSTLENFGVITLYKGGHRTFRMSSLKVKTTEEVVINVSLQTVSGKIEQLQDVRVRDADEKDKSFIRNAISNVKGESKRLKDENSEKTTHKTAKTTKESSSITSSKTKSNVRQKTSSAHIKQKKQEREIEEQQATEKASKRKKSDKKLTADKDASHEKATKKAKKDEETKKKLKS